MKSSNKKILTVVASLIAAVFLFIGTMCIQIKGDTIVKNMYINGVDIGGISKEEASEKLKKEHKIDNINLSYEGQNWDIQSSKVDFYYNIEDTVKKAYDISRSGSFFENLSLTIKSNFNNKNNLEFEIMYNEDKLKEEIKKISENINIDVADAKINISGSQINIEDEKEGRKVNIENTIANILDNAKEGVFTNTIIVDTVDPSIKKSDLQEVDTILGSYSTKVTGPVTGRHTNIRLATERTSNVLLMPGETFSYNEHTGLRSAENGYKYAPVIVQGVLQEGLGGGVCQVSSTLFNATLYAGLEYTQLRNHSIPSGYVKMGRDAVVSDTGLDFAFKNNLEHPIYIKNYMSGNVVTCQIYGSSKDKQNISITTNTDRVVEAPIKKVDDPSLLKGEEKVLEKGRNEYVVSTYRTYKDSNGKVLRTEKVLVSKYPKRQGVIAVGTKEEEIPEVPEPPVTPEPPKPPVEEDTNEPKPEVPKPEVPKPEEPDVPKPDTDQPQQQ